MPKLSAGRLFQFLSLFFCVLMLASRQWVAEDAYITMRVVENFFSGHGLVYNPGENIEAFTHPLWMMGLVVIRGVGLPLHSGSLLVCFLLSFSGLAYLIFRRQSAGKNLYLPVAALALASISGFRDFVSSGMETPLVFLLLTLLFTGLEENRLKDKPFYFATLLSLLYLTRPELVLLSPYYSAFFVWEVLREKVLNNPDLEYGAESERKWFYFNGKLPAGRLAETAKKMLLWALPFLIFAGGYHLFRFAYYDDIFPNTYYAKSGLAGYYSQGLKYLAHGILFGPGIWPILATLFLLPLLHRFRALLSPRGFEDYIRELVIILILLLYVVRLGGDFMAHRFILPEFIMMALLAGRFFNGPQNPLHMLFSAERFKKYLPSGIDPGWLVLGFFMLVSLLPVPLAKGYIVNERAFFTAGEPGLSSLLLGQDHPWGRVGRDMGRLQSCLGYEHFWIANSQFQAKCLKGIGLGYSGYAAGPGVKILDEQGLPDRAVAKTPVLLRGRPGHEHQSSLSQAIHKKALFCSSGEPAYDRAMLTNAGILINLDPNLLATVPNISKRLKKLKKLKSSGSVIIPRLEAKYGTSIEALLKQAPAWEKDALFQKNQKCWEAYPALTKRIFY